MPVHLITLGAELEMVRQTPMAANLIRTRRFQSHYDRTIVADDGSELPRGVENGGGCELVTPVLTANVRINSHGSGYAVENFNEIDGAITDLCCCAQDVNRSCGFHLHLGKPDLRTTRSEWLDTHVRTMLIIARQLEPKLYALCPDSRRNNRFCKPIGDEYLPEDYVKTNPSSPVLERKYDNKKRYCWLNLIETVRSGGLGTIEIRMLGNVRRPSYCVAWTELWLKLATFVAFVEPTLAINLCCYGGALDDEFNKVLAVKTSAIRMPTDAGRAADTSDPTADLVSLPNF